MDVEGRPVLSHTLRRLAAAGRVDDVIVATSVGAGDDPVAELARAEGVAVHRGSERDVLRRVRDAAASRQADAVVRITGDCPLIDPEVVDRVVSELADGPEACDYASNAIVRSYPRGLDSEALWMDALERIDRLGRSAEAREHVTWFAYRERPDLFLLRSVELGEDHSAVDWSVDTLEDLERIRGLVAAAGADAGWRALLGAAS